MHDPQKTTINPLDYGLSARTQLTLVDDNHFGIVKLIKSRIIRKDAEKIVHTAQQLRSKNPELKVSLICSHNICSKSILLLLAEAIGIIYQE